MGKRFTETERALIAKFYNDQHGLEFLTETFNVNSKTIYEQARKLGLKTRQSYVRWNSEADDMVRKFAETNDIEIWNYLKKYYESNMIRNRMRELGLVKEKPKKEETVWTEKEDEILYNYYPNYGRKVRTFLEGKTDNQIAYRAKTINVEFGWTKEDDELLKEEYSFFGNPSNIDIYGKTTDDIKMRVDALGLKK